MTGPIDAYQRWKRAMVDADEWSRSRPFKVSGMVRVWRLDRAAEATIELTIGRIFGADALLDEVDALCMEWPEA